MVWHSHMLNPRPMLEDCIRHAKMKLWASGFPWDVINECINNTTMEYTPGKDSSVRFQNMTGLSWDNLHDSPTKVIECPICWMSLPVPWTNGKISPIVSRAFDDFYGFADHNFIAVCPRCNATIDHERLKVAKFRKDVQALLDRNLPMPGTLTTVGGIPRASVGSVECQTHFPNHFLLAANQPAKGERGITDAAMSDCTSVSSLVTLLERRVTARKILKNMNGRYKKSSSLWPSEKKSFRRMMLRYWDNLTPFAIDLVGAVIRQGSFVQKMDQIDWLHSPTIMSTMERLIGKYHVFLDIMVKNPQRMVVPTLDCDLAWHSHMLTPQRYYAYSIGATTKAGSPRLLNHDDKVDENKLSDGFAWTSKVYRKVTGGLLYSECLCWYCQATRGDDLTTTSIFFSASKSRARQEADNLHNNNNVSSDPNKNPHISAHSAIAPRETAGAERRAKMMYLQSKYRNELRRIEKRTGNRGNELGYPVDLPIYGPYMAAEIHSDAYACNPACADSGVGGCAAGTCGGAGACGGADASADSGACGSGGCGGGGGGCGGGGCGGGCGG